jgi:putative peptidoglycan lipid II flippase
MAYGFGLLAIVLLRAAVASFLAQGDTKTPMYVSLGAVAVNVALKIALYEPMGIAGLAFATAAGAWINFGLLVVIAMRRGWMQPDAAFWKVCVAVAGSSALLALVAWLGWTPAQRVAAGIGHFQNEIAVALLAGAGIVIYGVVLVVALRALGVRLGRLPRQAADARQPASNGDLG